MENSSAAIEWLKKNVAFIDEKVRIVESDVVTALEGVKCDVVIANPPYIPDNQSLPLDVVGHEPASALFGGRDGMQAPLRFIAAAARLLKPAGFLALEHHETQGAEISAVLAQDFEDILLHKDFNDRPRFTTAVRR